MRRFLKLATVVLFTLTACEEAVTPPDTNQAPTADAGADQTVNERATATLAGSGTDPDGDALTYAWTGPAGITLIDADTSTASFSAPSVSGDTAFEFTLTVTDPGGLSGTDTVTVTVEPPVEPPVVECVSSPSQTGDVDLAGTLREVETGLPGRGVVRAYDATGALLDESIACDDGRFALTVGDASVTDITLQAALGTRDDHAFVRAVRVPARDDFNLEVNAVSFCRFEQG